MANTLKKALKEKLHIPDPPRGPVRLELARLRSEASKLPVTEARKTLLSDITNAEQIINAPVKTNTERAKSVQDTTEKCTQIELRLRELQNSVPPTKLPPPRQSTKSQEDKQLKAELLQLLDEAGQKIAKLFSGENGRPGVLLPGKDQGLSRNALEGEAAGIRLLIDNSIITKSNAATIRQSITNLTDRIGESDKRIQTLLNEVAQYDQLLLDSGRVLGALRPKMTQSVDQTPLALKRTALERALPPANTDLLNIEGIRLLADQLRDELGDFDFDDLSDLGSYPQRMDEQIVQQSTANGAVKLFETSKVGEEIEALKQVSLAPDQPPCSELMIKAAELRGLLADPKQKDVDAQGLIDALLEEIRRAQKQAVEQSVKAREETIKSLSTFKSDLEKVKKKIEGVQFLAPKGSPDFFAADVNALNGLLTEIAQLTPASLKDLSGDGLAGLVAAQRLLVAAQARMQTLGKALEAPKGTDGKKNVSDLPADLKQLESDLKAAGETSAPFTRFNKDALKKHNDDLDKIKKAMPRTSAIDTCKALEKLAADFAKTKKEMDEIAKVLDDEAYKKCVSIYKGVNSEALVHPNKFSQTIVAVKKEAAKQPPSLDQLKTLVAAAVKQFETVKSSRQMLQRATEEQPKLRKEADEARNKNAGVRDKLDRRRKGLALQLKLASGEVKKINGDENLIKQIDAMMEDAKIRIKSATPTDEAAVEAVLDRIQRHIDLVTANPKGEVARRRAELPKLYQEWTSTRAACGVSLTEVEKKVNQFKPQDQGLAGKVLTFAKAIEDYRQVFAEQPDGMGPNIDILTDDEQPQGARRQARELALGKIAELQRGLQAHPVSTMLAQSPMPAATSVPRRLLAGLDRLYFTVLTSVEEKS